MVVNAPGLSAAQKQAMFFLDPLQNPVIPGTFGTLYLLRRDLNDMRAQMPNSALWPRAMAIMAGLDLLAKFHANDDAIGGVGARYKGFLAEYITRDGTPNSANNEALYQFRNSLLHSFGWYSRLNNGTVYRFRLAQNQAYLLQRNAANPQNWIINLTQLEADFDQAIQEYEADINDATKPTIQFPAGNNIFENYGWMEIS